MRVGLLGLGEMGSAIAQRLLTRGHTVVGYEPDPRRAAAARDIGVVPADSPAEVTEQADTVVILMVRTVEQADAACSGTSGCLSHVEGKTLLVMSSLNAKWVQGLEREATARGGMVVDATTGSGADQILNGSMMVMVSGDVEARTAVAPVLDELVDQLEIVADWAGAAQVAKLLTMLTWAANMAGVVEAIKIANHYELDRAHIVGIVDRSPGASFASQNWQFMTEVMSDSHHVGNTHKDLRALLEQAMADDIEMPVATATLFALRDNWPALAEELYLS